MTKKPSINKTMAVAAIRNGTVIDHITPGQALAIVQLLNLAQDGKRITLGLNLPSQTQQNKDLIKVEDWELTPAEADRIAILSPNATINIIQDYEVAKKFKVSLPETIANIFRCPNPRCISNHEAIASHFFVKSHSQKILLQCRFCRKSFSQSAPELSLIKTILS